jgi:DNA-binding phage protein
MWDTAKDLKSKDDVLNYLAEVLNTQDRALLALALFNIARSNFVDKWPIETAIAGEAQRSAPT